MMGMFQVKLTVANPQSPDRSFREPFGSTPVRFTALLRKIGRWPSDSSRSLRVTSFLLTVQKIAA
jgi:hypothetical protein